MQMNYQFDTLNTIAACDAYVDDCGRDKTTQENRKNNLLERINSNNGSADLEADVAFLTVHIQNTESMISQNPPADRLRDLQIQLGELIREKASVERKLDQIGNNWKLDLAFEMNLCEEHIALKNDLITQVNAHKATLAA